MTTASSTARRRLLVSGAIAAAVVAVAVAGLGVGAFAGYRRLTADALFPAGDTRTDIVVVGVDARALAEVGRPWPWPRSVTAELVERVRAAGARLIVLDLVFAEPTADDAQLASALAPGDTVIASTGRLEVPAGSAAFPLRAVDYTAPLPALASRAAVGVANVIPDRADGVVRSAPLAIELPDGTIAPSLALAATRLLRGATDPITLRAKGVQVDDRSYPTEGHAVMRLNFSEGLDFDSPDAPLVGAAEILSGRADRERLRGAIVLIGATEPTLGDTKATPVDRDGAPGVFLHAAAIDTLLSGRHIEQVGDREILLWLALLVLAVALSTQWFGVAAGAATTVAAIGAYLLVAFARFDGGWLMDLVYPPGAAGLAFVASVGAAYFTEGRYRRRVAALFSQYVPARVAEQLIASRDADAAAAGVRVDIAVVFCDLRGFTALAARVAPSEVRRVLDIYYEHLTSIVLGYDGTVMQYVGDEIFAVFGAPVPRHDAAAAALRAALAMRAAHADVNARLARDGLPSVAWGIGVNFGPAVAAHVGSPLRRQYAVIGDTVNVGSRLCSLAGPGEVVCTDEVLVSLPADERPATVEVGPVALKGVDRALNLKRVTPAL